MTDIPLRRQLVSVAIEWQRRYGVAPAITSTLSEFDAALLVGCDEESYSRCMQNRTAVSRGADFVHAGLRYQVKANRPSGKPGSQVTLVAKANNYDWDRLIWVHYTTHFEIREAWMWTVDDYREMFHTLKRLSPADMRRGTRLR